MAAGATVSECPHRSSIKTVSLFLTQAVLCPVVALGGSCKPALSPSLLLHSGAATRLSRLSVCCTPSASPNKSPRQRLTMSNGGQMERKNRVFIGGISDRIQKEDIEREFGRFGKLTNVWVAQNPPGFAFVEFDHISEADLAVSEMNGKSFLGSLNKIRVEHSHGGGSRNRQRRGPPGNMGGRGSPGYNSGGGRVSRDRYNSGSSYDDGYRGSNGNSNGYQRRDRSDGYNSGGGRYEGGGRYDGGDRRRNFGQSSNGGRYYNNGPPQRYRSNSGSDRGYNGGGGGGSYGGMRNRSRSPPMGGRR